MDRIFFLRLIFFCVHDNWHYHLPPASLSHARASANRRTKRNRGGRGPATTVDRQTTNVQCFFFFFLSF
jgi:hypothetical protein